METGTWFYAPYPLDGAMDFDNSFTNNYIHSEYFSKQFTFFFSCFFFILQISQRT